MSLAILTVVGQCVGAGDYEQATRYAKKAAIDHVSDHGRGQPAILFFGKHVLAIFSLSEQALDIAGKVLPAACDCLLPRLGLVSFAFPNVLRAAGDAKYTMIISAASMWIVRFGISWLLVKQFHFRLEESGTV
ncbi:MAG: MATE family efflux transporter [Eubacteriales bacterium]